jgi:hypothetical protein
LEQQPNTKVDDCGVCNGDGSTCFLGIGVTAAAGIGAGVLAAIIIGAVAGAAIIGGIAGKKGYDAYMNNKNNMQGSQSNPMYKDEHLKGTNPFYKS